MLNKNAELLHRISRAIQNRGLKYFFIHSVRRLASSFEMTFPSPDMIRINPVNCICNYRCPMCWIQHLTPEEYTRHQAIDLNNPLTLEEYRKLFDSIPAGLREVNVVGGGEPLIHKEIAAIFRSIKQHGWKGNLISNGALLSESIAKEMIAMQWDITRISLNAGDRTSFKSINGVDAFDRVVNNLITFNQLRHRMGASKKVKLVVFHVIQKANCQSIDKLFQVAETVGADYIEFDLVMPLSETFRLTSSELNTIHSAISHYSSISSVPSNHEEILFQTKTEQNREMNNIPFIPGKSCSVGFDQAFITADGNVLPCCFSNEVMGNVRESSFKKIWNSKKYTDFRKRLIRGQFADYCIKVRCSLPGVLHQ